MPNPAIMFRVLVFFVLLALIGVGATWLIGWIFGIELGFFSKIVDWQRKSKEDFYRKKLDEIQKQKKR